MVARRGPPAGAAPSGPRHLLLRIGAPPLELEPNRTLVVGRQPDCDLSIPSGKVSRRHAEIYWKRDRPWIVDCGSQNGTTVNGRRITSDHELKDNDEILNVLLTEGSTIEVLGDECPLELAGRN